MASFLPDNLPHDHKAKHEGYLGEANAITQVSLDNQQQAVSENTTNDGSIDRNGNPAIRSRTGGWISAILLLGNQGFTQLAFFGLAVNLVLFLTRVLQQGNADAANNVSKWTGTVYIFSLVGAFLSDSYWGRYLTCTVFQLVSIMGLVLLSLSSWLLLIKPARCGDGELECIPVSSIGVAIFYLSIYLVALGNGGHQPTLVTFGADQFDETHPREQHSKVAFFKYFYLALNLGSLVSNTVLVYIEDTGRWVLGFWIAVGSALLALLLFWLGTPRYRHFHPCGNPLPRVAQVFVATAKKWDVDVPVDGHGLYELEGAGSVIFGSKKLLHTDHFRFLDKAAILTDKDITLSDPWRLCTVTQVEEAKCVLKMLPIWLCTIMYSVVFTQMASLFVEQGATMDSNFTDLHIPPASMSAFDISTVSIFIIVYDKIIPVTGRITGHPKGLSELQRMGFGLAIGMLAMVTAGVVEVERLKRLKVGDEISSLSILWQIPQYALIGVSEVFMYVGQLEFFHGQAPDGIKSFGSSLCMASISLGNFVSSFIVTIVMDITTRNGELGWIPEDLNLGHLDRFFFLLAGLSAIDLMVYIFCAKRYKYMATTEIGLEELEEKELVRKV